MELQKVNEVKGFEIKKDTSEVCCRLFKDNSNALEIIIKVHKI